MKTKRGALGLAALAAGLAFNSPALLASAAPSGAAGAKFSHPRAITNPYLPLASLKQDILVGREGGKRVRVERTARPDRRKTFKIGDQKVPALAVEDRELENGELTELTIDYFAQADDGTVYYLGEEVDEYKHGKVVGHEGAWMYGRDTRKLTPIMPGNPRVGDRFRSEDVSQSIFEEDEVVSLTETITVPAGTFHECLKIKETLADGSVEYKYYAKGVGCVREVPAEGDVLLQSHTTVQKPSRSARNAPAGTVSQAPGGGAARDADPLARAALSWVGVDPAAEAYWSEAINDPSLSADERQNLIEDLNEDGLSDPKHPRPGDLPLIMSRLALIEYLAPAAMDRVNAEAFLEAYKDLLNLADVALGRGEPVK
jgi:DUF3108-like